MSDLHRSWREMQPSAPGGDLASEPESVRAPIERLRAAWHALEVSADGSEQFVHRVVRERRRTRRHRWLLAAAIMLGITTLGRVVARVTIQKNGNEVRLDPAAPAPRTASAPRSPTPIPSRPRVLLATADRIEMRAGSVHLVLVTPTPQPTDPNQENSK